MPKYSVKVKDSRPQVGIFEIVEGILLVESEDTQGVWRDRFFDGTTLHRHSEVVKTLVKNHPGISAETKLKFERDPAEYLRHLRGRVDYDTINKTWHIMSNADVLNDSDMIERITRAFHLPPYLSGKIELEQDEGHYGV